MRRGASSKVSAGKQRQLGARRGASPARVSVLRRMASRCLRLGGLGLALTGPAPIFGGFPADQGPGAHLHAPWPAASCPLIVDVSAGNPVPKAELLDGEG